MVSPGTLTMTNPPVLQQHDRMLNSDIPYSGRILRPTFSRRSTARDMNWSALNSAWNIRGDETVPSHLSEAFTIPADFDENAYRSLVDTFFDRRWPYLPVLHRPSFNAKHFNPFLCKSATSGISSSMVNIVCAVAATEKSWLQHEDIQIHRAFFGRAVQGLHIVMGSDDLECVQCLLLLCMYGHNEPQSVNMWYTTSLALQLAIGIDLASQGEPHRPELALHGNVQTCLLVRVCYELQYGH